MKKLFLIATLLTYLTSCGPSTEETRQVEMEQQRIEREASEKLAQEKANRIAAVTCSIMNETGNMDAAVRVRELNDAREKMGGEPFLRGDAAIKEAFEWELCQELVLNENYDEILQSLKDTKREEERIAAEEIRIACLKTTVKETFHGNGKLESRTNYQCEMYGGKKHGLSESYYENGQMDNKKIYKEGYLHGLSESYYENGQLWTKSTYKDGKLVGHTMGYYSNGSLRGKHTYNEGYLHGLYESYYENGQLRIKSTYKDGKLDGLQGWYKENGILETKINYKDGELDGLYESFDNDGQIESQICYIDGGRTVMSYCKQ